MKKIAPSDRLRKELKEFIEGLQDVESAQEALTQLVQLSTRLICQEGFEAHQRDHLGVDRYKRGEGRRGYRSGYEPGYLDTAEGRLEVAIPQVRDPEEPYRCSLYDLLRGDSGMVQRLATEMYARGLSTRDIEDAFTDEQGVACLAAARSAKSPKSFGNNTRPSRNAISATFLSCACSWTACTSRFVPTASPGRPCCAPGASHWTAGKF